jgi:2-polyprenyl-3-methyl-5-hydroxy-6-metoxy-1,4-benzoquinol methylase
VARGPDRAGVVDGEFTVVRCPSCGTWRLDPAPEPEAIARLYPVDYEAHRRAVAVPDLVLPTATHRWRRRFVEWRAFEDGRFWTVPARRAPGLLWSWLFSHTDRGKYNLLAFPGEGRSLLDVGCGSGELLASFASLGWNAMGIEPSAPAVERARSVGLRAVHGRFPEDAERVESEAPFGAIVLANVLEHLDDPRAALERAFRLLEPSGYLLIWTPVCDGWQQRWRPEVWYNLDIPRHLHLYTRRGLTSLLTQCGFRVVAARPSGSARAALRTVANRLRDTGRGETATRVETGAGWRVAATPLFRAIEALGGGDVIEVLAVKPWGDAP